MQTPRKTTIALALAMGSMMITGLQAHPGPGRHDNPRILTSPIAGVKNDWWYDYLSDVAEAKHELRKDLARATDDEDRRDAREEYRNELRDAIKDYAKEMRERGYPVGSVTVVGY